MVSWSNLMSRIFQKRNPAGAGFPGIWPGLRGEPLPVVLALAGRDRDLPRPGFRLLRQLELQKTVSEIRLDLVPVHRGRQSEGSGELTIRALHARVIAVFLLGLALALARDRQHVSVELDLDVVLPEARQLRSHGDLIRVFGDVNGGHPGARRQHVALVPTGQRGRPEEIPEKAR